MNEKEINKLFETKPKTVLRGILNTCEIPITSSFHEYSVDTTQLNYLEDASLLQNYVLPTGDYFKQQNAPLSVFDFLSGTFSFLSSNRKEDIILMRDSLFNRGELKLLAGKLNKIPGVIETTSTGILTANDVYDLLDTMESVGGENQLYCSPYVKRQLRTLNIINDGKIEGIQVNTLSNLNNMTSGNPILWYGNLTKAFILWDSTIRGKVLSSGSTMRDRIAATWYGKLNLVEKDSIKSLSLK